MKRCHGVFIGLLFSCLIMAISPTEVDANVFASDIKIVNSLKEEFDCNLGDDTPYVGIQFRLNEDATLVTVSFYNRMGERVATIDTSNCKQGVNLILWYGKNDSGFQVPEGDYSFSITAIDSIGHSNYDVIYARSGTRISTRGVTSIRNQKAPNFGHPIGGNAGDAGLKRGPLNFFADGTGFEFEEPGLSRYSPFDVRDYGGIGRPYMLTSDEDGFLYYTDRLDQISKIYRLDPSLDPTTLAVVTTSDDPNKKGHGLCVVGSDSNKSIFWGLGNTVVRAKIDTAHTFDPKNFEVIAIFEPDTLGEIFVKDIVIDDSSYMYVALRRGSEPTGKNPGLAIEKYNISDDLPLARSNRLWSIPVGLDNNNGRPVGLGIYRGSNDSSNVDDVIYFSCASSKPDSNWNTIRRIIDLQRGESVVIYVDSSGSGTTSIDADLTVDVAGNIIWTEPISGWIIALSPPDGINYYITKAYQVIPVVYEDKKFVVELRWDKRSTDLDLYWIGATPGDTTFWQHRISSISKTKLDVDDTDGYGPEKINQSLGCLKADSLSYIGVHYFGPANGEPVKANILFQLNDSLLYTAGPCTLNPSDWWDVFGIYSPSGLIVPFDSCLVTKKPALSKARKH